ncbi:MAG TPA: ABATE domain-containing protein, partial [Dongiaceae bacterium]|nr:ABATE domain-containing protein [Dongiaceae bacterium]
TVARPPAIFVGGAPGLDFLNSIATPVDIPVDWIDDGEGLLRWLAEAKLVPAEVLAGIRARARPAELDKVAAEARDLREWFRGFLGRHKGRPLTAADLAELAPLNRLLARDESFSRIVPEPGSAPGGAKPPLRLRFERNWSTAEALLLPIAQALAELVCSEDFAKLKACEGPVCTLYFVDRTRGHARRWCSMAICGNRAKQAAHRHRLKALQG